MKPRSYFAVTFISVLLVYLAFQTLPVSGVNEVQAQDLPPMPTYDWDPINEKDYPDISDYDGYIFRTVECKIDLIANAADVNLLLPGGSGWIFPTSDSGEATVEVSWIYRILNQWPTNTLGYDSTTHETIGSVSIGVLAFKPGVGLRYFIIADVRSPGDAVAQNNATAGGGYADVSREGHLEMEFRSKSKSNGESTLRFKAKVKEPISGLKVEVNANLPEGQGAIRRVTNFPLIPPPPLRILFMDLSETPPVEGPPFRWWSQNDRYEFDETTQGFELKVKIANDELKLPGNKVLPIIEISKSLSLRRNGEYYVLFD
jgi:hypothetical protein